MRTIIPNVVIEKNKYASKIPWVKLLEISVTDLITLFLTDHPSGCTFRGQVYEYRGFTIDSLRSDTKGGLESVRVSLSNVDRVISAFVETYDIRGNRVVMIDVPEDQLSDDTATLFEEVYGIESYSISNSVADVVLGHARVLQQRSPAGRYYKDNCRWIYKSTECGYVGGLATCDKIVGGTNGCRAHDNTERFGGFPNMPNMRR